MLEKIKEIPFIDESRALKVKSVNGKIILERNDKVIWAQESTGIEAEGIDCFVEAKKFFALYEDIKSMEQGTCLTVTLKNGAKYELPFLAVHWDEVLMPDEYEDTITFKISDLMITTLRNLIKPELQCIYIDENGAVSCDIISACISNEVKASHPFLLPLDVQELVVDRICKVNATTDTLYLKGVNFSIATVKPTLTDDWYNQLREMVVGVEGFVPTETLNESISRLSLFDDYVRFDGEKVIAGSNFEPFIFKDLEDKPYEINKLSKILPVVKFIAELDNNLILKNDGSLFLISAIEEA